MPQALLEDAEPQSQTQLQSRSRVEAGHDARHTLFRGFLVSIGRPRIWLPRDAVAGRDGKALKDFLSASPQLTETQFRQMLGNRARSAVAHGIACTCDRQPHTLSGRNDDL